MGIPCASRATRIEFVKYQNYALQILNSPTRIEHSGKNKKTMVRFLYLILAILLCSLVNGQDCLIVKVKKHSETYVMNFKNLCKIPISLPNFEARLDPSFRLSSSNYQIKGDTLTGASRPETGIENMVDSLPAT